MYWEFKLNQTRMTEQMEHAFERNILGRIYGSKQEKRQKPSKRNRDIYSLYVYLNIVCDITIFRLGWKEEGSQKNLLLGNSRTQDQLVNQEKVGRAISREIHVRC